MAQSEGDCDFFACYLQPFSAVYDQIHIPLSALICIFGSISNVINVIILTRKEMRTPVNVLLTGLSVAQFLLALNYLILLAIEQFKVLCYAFPWTYGAAVYRLLNVNCNIVFHTVAFAHTLVLAFFRYLALQWPITANRSLLQIKTAISSLIFVWTFVPLLCTPVFLTSNVSRVHPETAGCKLEKLYDLNYSQNAALVAGIFWMFGIVLKLIPSLVLSILLISLVRSLKRVERRRQIGFPTSFQKMNDSRQFLGVTSSNSSRNPRMAQTQRTTKLLIVIMILCLSVEFPHGMLNLGTAIYGEKFGIIVYDHLGSFMEMLTLFYSSVSFTLYCIMSNDFQNTFHRLFLSSCRERKHYKLEQSYTISM